MGPKIVVLVACCALALATAACSASTAPTDPYTDFTLLLPPTPLDQLVGRATTIITDRVVSVGDGVAELKVGGVLKGDAPVGGELAVRDRGQFLSPSVCHSGVVPAL